MKNENTEAVFELQPVLNRVEVNTVIRSISSMLDSEHEEKLVAIGTDYSGRFWCWGFVKPAIIRRIAGDFYSL